MTMLATLFREKMKETKDYTKSAEMTFSVSYGTGFLPLDYALGYVQETTDDVCTYELGLSDGSINTLIGNSGTGKTSLLVAIACNIAKRFNTSAIFMDQAEVGTHIMRLKNITDIRNNQDFVNKFIIRDAGITIESIYKRVKAIHDIKIANPKKYLYDTGIIGLDGEKVMKFEPTIYIVDSLKLVLSEKNSEAGETNNMTGATNAKANAEYYTKMVPLCRMANIIMILVNHITPRVNTNSFVHQSAEFPFLNQDEHLSNGKLLQYISNTMLKLKVGDKLIIGDKSNPYNINGSIVNIDIIKSRTNKSGRGRCSLVFDQELGFDPDLSILEMLKSNKILEGSSGRYRIPGCDIVFTMKNFKQILYTNNEFRYAFNMFSGKYIIGLLSDEYERIRNDKLLTSGQSSYDSIIEMMSKPTTIKDIENRDKSIKASTIIEADYNESNEDDVFTLAD